jgi:L-fucose isomerase-like protein
MCCSHLSRREFVELAAAGSLAPAVSAAPAWDRDLWNPDRPLLHPGRPLKVQPVLMYSLPARKEQASWKSWGGVQTAQAANEEAARIASEWKALAGRAGFGIDVLPVARATNAEDAARVRDPQAGVCVLYPATGSGAMLRAAIGTEGDTVIFVRHRSGPAYYWYEALSTRYLRPDGVKPSPADQRRLSVNDVVVDDPAELVWRMRALYAAHNFTGSRIVALGGAQGKYAPNAPQFARERFKLDIVETTYEDLGLRIKSAMSDPARLELAGRWADRYLRLPKTTLETRREFVVNAFVLYGVFKDILQEHNATAFTINQCMSTIIPMSRTTACLTLGLLNDEGLLAFCESDFVIVPAGMFLRHLAGRPVFLHNSTFPHNGIVTCAHCTAPRRMDGARYEPARILTHYESEYGAAPKVEIPPGQQVTFINPEYATGRWVGMTGTVESNPFYEICRSQQDVRINGNWRRLLNEVRDSHWVMAYGDLLKEIGYAAPRLGVDWDPVT